MRGSVKPCWTVSRIGPTFWRPARSRIGAGGPRKNETDPRKAGIRKGVSRGNDGWWKAWKTKSRFSTLPTALGSRLRRDPHCHSYGGGSYSYGKAKQKPHPTNHVPRWAKTNRRSGPKEVAKRMGRIPAQKLPGDKQRVNAGRSRIYLAQSNTTT